MAIPHHLQKKDGNSTPLGKKKWQFHTLGTEKCTIVM
jgi:hypothetical protein